MAGAVKCKSGKSGKVGGEDTRPNGVGLMKKKVFYRGCKWLSAALQTEVPLGVNFGERQFQVEGGEGNNGREVNIIGNMPRLVFEPLIAHNGNSITGYQ
jgi:hypothetical protein